MKKICGIIVAVGLAAGCGGGSAVKKAAVPAAPVRNAVNAQAVATQAAAQAAANAAPAVERMRNPGTALVAVLTTERGTVKFVMSDGKAPITVSNFVRLADKGFYSGLTFHRVVPGFVVQGGDPKGDGSGGPGWSIKGEFTDLPHLKGAVAMARNSDPDSAGSQFYICLEAQPALNGKYAVFGYVIEGMDVVSSIQRGDKMRDVKVEEIPLNQVPTWVPK